MGKTSVYLTSDLDARWRKSGVPLATLIRRGLEASEGETVTLAGIRSVVREELSALPAAVSGSQRGYEPDGLTYEPYEADP